MTIFEWASAGIKNITYDLLSCLNNALNFNRFGGAKKIIMTFDYELFFGDQSGTVKKSIIEPTNQILDALDSIGAKAVFFIDYLMLKYMNNENARTKQEAVIIVEQLKDIVRRGHRIELHIHPHWVDAKYNDGYWDFSDFSHYCLSAFSDEEITEMFIEGTNMLETIAKDVDSQYKLCAFRAGGWAIFPFDIMKDGFRQAGISVDSSVCQGMIINANGYTLDFRDVPSECVYSFTEDIKQREEHGEFIEAQICSFRFNVVTTILNILYHKRHPESFIRMTDGSHYRMNDKKTPSKPLTKWDVLHQSQTFGLCGTPSYILNFYVKKAKQKYVVMICHPKDIMPITCRNIIGLKEFTFCTYNDILK